MLKKLCVAVVVALSMGCGGSDSDGGAPVAAKPTLTVGDTVVAAGESKAMHAAVGDTLTVVASEVVPQLDITRADGKACDVTFPDGLETGVDTYRVKIGPKTVGCLFAVTFDEGVAALTVLVP